MKKNLILVAAVIAALGLAAYLGFSDGKEHRETPEQPTANG